MLIPGQRKCERVDAPRLTRGRRRDALRWCEPGAAGRWCRMHASRERTIRDVSASSSATHGVDPHRSASTYPDLVPDQLVELPVNYRDFHLAASIALG